MDKRLDELAREYLLECDDAGLTQQTIYNYGLSLKKFPNLTFGNMGDIVLPRLCDRIAREMRWSDTVKRHRFNHLTGFIGWLFYQNHILRRHKLRTPRYLPKHRMMVSDVDLQMIFEDLERRLSKSPAGYKFNRGRDLLALRLLTETGIRVSECGSIRFDHLNVRSIFINGNKSEAAWRTVPVSAELMSSIKEFAVFCGPGDSIWTNAKGIDSFDKINLLKTLGDSCSRAGVKRITPHDLRFRFIVKYILDGGTMFRLMAIIGHSSADMTAYYFNQVRRMFPHTNLAEEVGMPMKRLVKNREKKRTRHVVFHLTDEELRDIQRRIVSGEIKLLTTESRK